VARVRASLRSFARYAPEEIVRDVVVSGREAMLSGEKREVTLLFCDLRGFTRISEKTRPEDVVAMLNAHFGALASLIAKHGGFVVDFLGDSLFAVFGAPEASIDHAARAVACGIEMQIVCRARDEETRFRGWPPMEIGVGINTGPAVVGNMGSQRRIKYGVVGHSVNLAARIETFTVSGQVLVSESTREALDGRLVAEGPLEAEGKGVETSIRMWDVRGLRAVKDGPDGVSMELPSPVHDLLDLGRPLDARIRLIHGKRIESEVHAAQVTRLGASGSEFRSAVPVPVFTAVQVLLLGERAAVGALDGTVIRLSEQMGAWYATVRFGGLDWDRRALLCRVAVGGAVPPEEMSWPSATPTVTA
jgi:adenylate cyclase